MSAERSLRDYQREASAAATARPAGGPPEVRKLAEWLVLSDRGRARVSRVEVILLGKTEEEAQGQAGRFAARNRGLRVSLLQRWTGKRTDVRTKRRGGR